MARNQTSKGHIKMLQSFLGIWDQPDEHYPKVDGSCDWIDARDDFQEWRDPPDELLPIGEPRVEGKNPAFYWVHANPGTGKTFLAAHVVSELQEFKLECSYYFFHVGNKFSCSLANFLRSLAHQMAISNALIREKLITLVQEGISLDIDDPRSIWTKIFKRGIFQVCHPSNVTSSLELSHEDSPTYPTILGNRCHGRVQQIPRIFYSD